MAFPPAHALVAFGFAEVGRTVLPVSRRRAWLLAAALSIVPDFDFVVGLAVGRASEFHGDATHSLGAAVIAGLLVWLVAGWRWGVFAGLGYASHLLVDLADGQGGPTNMMLWWPLSKELPRTLGPIFPVVHYEHGEGVWGAALSLLEAPAFLELASQTLVGAAGFLILLGVAFLVRRLVPARPSA